MKKIIFSLGALLVFGIASAQTTPVTTTKKQAATTTTTDVTVDAQKNSQIKPDAINKNDVNGVDATQSRKDKLITNDHVKSTTAPQKGKDSTSTKSVRKTKKVKQ